MFPGQFRSDVTPAKTEQSRRYERRACSIGGPLYKEGVSGTRTTVSATTDSTGVPVSLFLSSDRGSGEVSKGRVLIKKSGRLQKLPQRLIPYLTGFFPGAKLVARLFHGKATSFAVDFPGIPFWRRAAMFHFDPKFSIEVWPRHNVPFALSIAAITAVAAHSSVQQ